MKGIWTGDKGKQRWFCRDCPKDFETRRALLAHQEIEDHDGFARGAVQWG